MKTQPVYPPIAKAAHVGGTVVLHAIISKQGTIENLVIVSGPPMLANAARDAVMYKNGIATYHLPETVPVLEGQVRVL